MGSEPIGPTTCSDCRGTGERDRAYSANGNRRNAWGLFPSKAFVTVKGFADNDANNADLSVPKNPGLSAAAIMMLSSAGKRGDAARCATWGFSAYLTKSIGQAELLETAVQALDGRDAGRRFFITQK